MSRKDFLSKLTSNGFSKSNTSRTTPVYTHRANDLTVHVGIIPTYDDSPYISLDYYRDTDPEETEREYSTFAGAWNAIRRLIS